MSITYIYAPFLSRRASKLVKKRQRFQKVLRKRKKCQRQKSVKKRQKENETGDSEKVPVSRHMHKCTT